MNMESLIALGKDRKKLWVILAIVALFLAEGGAYIFLSGKSGEVHNTLLLRNKEIAAAMSSGLAGLDSRELAQLRQRADRFKSGFAQVSQISSTLSGISDQAEKNRIRVVSIRSEDPVMITDEKNEPVNIPGLRFQRLPISLKVEGNSRSLADFLYSLTVTSAHIFVVESYLIKRLPAPSTQVSCDMALSFFSNS